MNRIRKSRRMDPETARLRRMSTYGQAFYAILRAAQAGIDHMSVFEDWHEATAFASRYSQFRLDILQDMRKMNSAPLADMYRTGHDAKGEKFDTKREGTAPYTLIWRYRGLPPEALKDVELDEALGLAGTQQEEQQQHSALPKSPDAGEQYTEGWLNGKTPKAAECAHEADATGTRCLKCNRPMPAK